MSLQSIYQILTGDYLVTAGICMLLCLWVSCADGRFSWTVTYSLFLLITKSKKSHLCPSLTVFFFVVADGCYFKKATYTYTYLYRDVSFFHHFDWAYVCPFPKLRFLNKQCQMQQLKRKPIYAYYLSLADSIKPMLGTCQNKVNYHWFSCDSWRSKRA